VVANGLNRLPPGAQQAVAAALESGSGDVEIHVLGLNPLALVVEFFRRDNSQHIVLFRVVPDADGGGSDHVR
jgi:hypothetical protein